jgi:hypothetical protein
MAGDGCFQPFASRLQPRAAESHDRLAHAVLHLGPRLVQAEEVHEPDHPAPGLGVERNGGLILDEFIHAPQSTTASDGRLG